MVRMKPLAIVTGANRGIGFQTARGLAKIGHAVLLACRDREAGCRARELILAESPEAELEVAVLDLSSLSSIRNFAATFLDGCPRLSVLVNNAGTIVPDHRETAEGHEFTIGVNYLGQYLLTRLLVPALTPGRGRIINVSSSAYRIGRVKKDFFESGKARYHEIGAYADSKLAFILFSLELSHRLAKRRIAVNAVDPGIVNTGMIHLGKWFDPLADIFYRPFIRTEEDGARSSIWLAGLEDWRAPGSLWIVKGREARLPSRIVDHPLRAWLWENTERILGLEPLSPEGGTE